MWWIKLGIRVDRIQPGKPQQNGRQERFHRTLKAETAKPPRADMRAQQRAFDSFRRIYNEERPHESPWEHIERIDKNGFLRWHDERLFISRALAHEDVAIEYEGASEEWLVIFGPL